MSYCRLSPGSGIGEYVWQYWFHLPLISSQEMRVCWAPSILHSYHLKEFTRFPHPLIFDLEDVNAFKSWLHQKFCLIEKQKKTLELFSIYCRTFLVVIRIRQIWSHVVCWVVIHWMISNPALGESLMNWIICGANTTMSGMLSELSLCSCLGFGCFFLFDLFALKSFILRLISIVSALYLNLKSDFVFRRKKIFPNSRNCKLLWQTDSSHQRWNIFD